MITKVCPRTRRQIEIIKPSQTNQLEKPLSFKRMNIILLRTCGMKTAVTTIMETIQKFENHVILPG